MQVTTLKKTLPCQLVGFLDSTMQSGLCSLVGAYQRNNIIHDGNKICHTWTHDNWFHDLYCTMWNLPESFPSPASTASPWTSNGVFHLGSLHKVHIIERNKEPKHKKTLTECHVYNIMLNQAGVNASSQIIIRLLTWLLEFLTAEPSHFLKVLTLWNIRAC